MRKYSFKLLGGLVVISAVILSWITVGVNAGSDFIYADADASGTEDGSSDHPFKKIQDALDEARDEERDVYVRAGEYEENLKVWEGIKLQGSDQDEVEIKADDDDDPVIKMYDDTEIRGLTLKDGQYGVLVNDGSNAYVEDCKIIDNDDDGIYAEKSETKNDEKLEVYNSTISDNGWNGIYLEEKKFSIKNNEIFDNDKDGVEFKKGSEGVFEKNRVKHNDGVGLRATIDGSEIYVKNNTFRDNDKSGMEVRAEGAEGLIIVNFKNKFYKNEDFGIVRVEENPFQASQWNRSFEIQEGTNFWDNENGDVSHFIKVY
jgi:hypothetical protein